MTLTVAALAVLLLLGVGASVVYLADDLTRCRRRRVQGSPADVGLRYEEAQFLTADRLTLRGWFLESPGARAVVVLVHDLEATRTDVDRRLLDLARDYVRRGYSVFTFDLRGHGESGGTRDTLGRDEKLDVAAAVACVRRRMSGVPVILHGFGFGAAVALAAAANRADVTAVVADSAFPTMREYLHRRWRWLPSPALTLVGRVARRLYGADIDALEPVAIVNRVGVPVLYIHNQGDTLLPPSSTLNLAAASLDARDQVWISAGRGHATGSREAPDAYVRRVVEFYDQVIPARVLAARAV
jgi:pimeloyl-ACP methyl ester carboxylesterase